MSISFPRLVAISSPIISSPSVAISSNNFMSLSLLLLGLYNGNAVLLDIVPKVP